jgi:hypothetical protein
MLQLEAESIKVVIPATSCHSRAGGNPEIP